MNSRAQFNRLRSNQIVDTVILRSLSLIIIAATAIFWLFSALFTTALVDHWLMSLLIAAGLIGLFAPRRGYPVFGAMAMLGMIWCVLVFDAYRGDPGAENLPMGFMVIILLALVTLRNKTWLVVLLMSIVANAYLLYLSHQDVGGTLSAQEALSSAVAQTIMLVLIASMLNYFSLRLTSALAEAVSMNEELRKQRADLRRSEDQLAQINDNIAARIIMVDTAHNMLYMNNEFMKRYNVSRQDVTIQQALGSERYAAIEPYFKRGLAGETVTYELQLEIDGRMTYSMIEVRPFYEHDEVAGIYSLAIDVTERREIENQLRVQTRILQHVTDNLPARIAYVGKDRVTVFANKHVSEHYARGRDLSGVHVSDYIPKERLKQLEAYRKRAWQGERVTFEESGVSESGQKVTEQIHFYPHMQDGQVHGLFTLATDISAMRMAEDALNRSQKLESLGILAGGIAHDFNNLLVAMLGQNSLALAKTEENHPAQRHIMRSVDAAQRASTLTQQMLAYSGRGSFAVTNLDLNSLIQDNLELFKVSLHKGVQLVTHLHQSVPAIEADEAQIQQLIMNLIINASDAIGEDGGRITISTSVHQLSADEGEYWAITGDPLVPGNYVMVQVQDDGSGMGQATIDKIFDPFFTTKATGTGLGLAAAIGIVRGHQGGISLYSEVGRGTVFNLMFPVTANVSATQKSAPAPTALPAENMITILVVDDEPMVVETVGDMLEAEGLRCLRATGGKQAVELYAANTHEITIVLLDLMMPEMDGEATFQALRNINPDVSVILSSGYSEAEATRRFVGRGLANFIQKPYRYRELIDKVVAAIKAPTM